MDYHTHEVDADASWPLSVYITVYLSLAFGHFFCQLDTLGPTLAKTKVSSLNALCAGSNKKEEANTRL